MSIWDFSKCAISKGEKSVLERKTAIAMNKQMFFFFFSCHPEVFYLTLPITVCTLEFLQFKPLTFLRITSTASGPLSLLVLCESLCFLGEWKGFCNFNIHKNLVSPLSISGWSITYSSIFKNKQKYFSYKISNNVLLENNLLRMKISTKRIKK